ncbi:DUF1996 domain-containing protein [Streptomyces capparidis]
MSRQQRHKRSPIVNRTVAAVAVLALGGGGIAFVTANASAGGSKSGGSNQQRNVVSATDTIDCPDVGLQLPEVPQRARAEVDRNLALLDRQVAEAYERLRTSQGQGGPNFVQNAILGPLKDKRVAAIDRIAIAIGRGGTKPQGLDRLAACTLKKGQPQPDVKETPQQNGGNGDGGNTGGGNNGGDQGGNGQAGNGPVASDFVDITKVQPNVQGKRNRGGASTGTFTSRCGTNENGHFNSDNMIVAPGVSNGAHHMHDYVGNLTTDGFSTNESLAAAGTTCTNGDKSAYFWPVLRVQDGTQERDAAAPGGGTEGNVGRIVKPSEAQIFFQGNPRAKVTAMPRFLRIITGDAKAHTNGTANANASWSCTGFENRVQLKDKYPLCPAGSKVVRTFKFQSCWDGQNIDSANHRTHVAFAAADGSCPQGFRAIPQLVQRLVYDVPAQPNFAVDSFPEQLHKPVTDHGDFVNVLSDRQNRQVANCLNSGRRC